MKGKLLSYLIDWQKNIAGLKQSKSKVDDEHLRYDAWLRWNPTNRCNLDCVYCFTHNSLNKRDAQLNKINIPSLIKALDESNKTFKIEFTGGGEPFLVPNLIEACMEITKKHFVFFNTNLACGNVQEFARKINPDKVIQINTSIHIEELKKYNLVEKVIENYLFCRKKGFHMFARMIAYPPLVNEAKKYKDFFKARGINFKFSGFIGTYNGEKYPKAYTAEEVDKFQLDTDSLKKQSKYPGICNAGYNVAFIKSNGDISPCSLFLKGGLGNIYKKITLKRCLLICPVKECGCPVKIFDVPLFEKALKENKTLLKRIHAMGNSISVSLAEFLYRLYDVVRRRVYRYIQVFLRQHFL